MTLVVLVAAGLLSGCGPADDTRYLSPAQTFRTYVEALDRGDAGATWDCYSASYHSQILGGDRAAWEATFQRQLPELKRAEKRREIVQERVINARLAYVLF
ncbi:MAG: hypothetical protein ABIL09_05130, partial [Gemmatimonadota bacterium]